MNYTFFVSQYYTSIAGLDIPLTTSIEVTGLNSTNITWSGVERSSCCWRLPVELHSSA